MAIITRASKGSALTHTEMDNNFNEIISGLNSKQATLVNQTNIKSINGTSLLGSGDLSITFDEEAYDTAHSFTTNGYQKLSNGFTIQWGIFTHTGTTYTLTFPIAFPNSCVSFSAGTYISGDTDGFSGGSTAWRAMPTASSVDLTTDNYSLSWQSYWIAIGY
jgi:hypothetical protein